MAVVYRSFESILQGMINRVVSRSSLNDVTDSSVMKHLLAAPARELDEAYFQLAQLRDAFSIRTATGRDLDDRAADVLPALISRRPASRALGSVVFGRTATVGTVLIPAGTAVTTASGIGVKTTAAVTIGAGNTTSPPATAIADVAGASGNVAVSTLTKFGAKPAGVDTVTNTVAFVGGSGEESDDAFRARIEAFVSSLSRSTPEALEFVAREVSIPNGQRVVTANVVEDVLDRGEVTLFIDDGAGTAESVLAVVGEVVTANLAGPPVGSAVGGEEFIRLARYPVKTTAPFTLTSSTRGALTSGTQFQLDDASGYLRMTPTLVAAEVITASYTAFTGLIAEVQKVVDGDPTDRDNYPGWRAAGVRVRVATPAVLLQTIEADVLVSAGYVKGANLGGGLYTAGSVLAQVAAVLNAYINGLGIGVDVLRAELIEKIMGIPGVLNVVLNEPATDVIVLDDQLPRVTSGNIILS